MRTSQEVVPEEMAPLLRRGTARLRRHLADTPKSQLPIGVTSIHVVTEKDFVKHAAVILRYVVCNGTATHVLCENGSLCASIERRTGKRWHK